MSAGRRCRRAVHEQRRDPRPRRPATGRGCGPGGRRRARGSRGRCSPGRPCAATPSGPAPATRRAARWRRTSCRAPLAGAAIDDARDAHHSIPRWPFWPASIGCLTLVISTTRSAASISAGCGVAAGDDHVLVPGPVRQRRHDVVDVDPAPLDRVGELVEDVAAVALGGEVALDLRPALARGRGVVVLGARALDPRPALAHLVPGDRRRPRRSASCSRPSARNAASSPTRHLALLTNWNTPIGQPWFQARSASPNAAVDFPFMSPVCTISSGRLRRCRVVRPSSGTVVGYALRHQATVPVSGARPTSASRAGRELVQLQARAAELRRRGPRPGRAAPARTRSRRRCVATPVAREAVPRPGIGSPPAVCRPSVTTTSSGRRSRVAHPLDAQGGVRLEQPGGQRRAAAGRQRRQPGRGRVDRRGRRQQQLGAGAAERDQPDLVAALVGVEQQRQHRALDRAPSAARAAIDPLASTTNSTRLPSRPSRAARADPHGAASRPGAGRRPRSCWCGAAATSVRDQVQRAGRGRPVGRPRTTVCRDR